MKPYPVLASGVAGGIEQGIGLLRIVGIMQHIAVVGPMLRRQNAIRQLALITKEIVEYGLAVNGEGRRLPHPDILQYWIAQIKAKINYVSPRLLHHLQITFMLKGLINISAQRIEQQVGAAFTQLQSASGGVRHNGKAHPLNVRTLAPIIVMALNHHLAVRHMADKPKRA